MSDLSLRVKANKTVRMVNGTFVPVTECSDFNWIALICDLPKEITSFLRTRQTWAESEDTPELLRPDDWISFLRLFSPPNCSVSLLGLVSCFASAARWRLVIQMGHPAAEQPSGQKQTAERILIGCILLDFFFQSESSLLERTFSLFDLWSCSLLCLLASLGATGTVVLPHQVCSTAVGPQEGLIPKCIIFFNPQRPLVNLVLRGPRSVLLVESLVSLHCKSEPREERWVHPEHCSGRTRASAALAAEQWNLQHLLVISSFSHLCDGPGSDPCSF